MYQAQNTPNKETIYNAAFLSIERLNDLLKDCNKYSTMSRFIINNEIQRYTPNPEILRLWAETLKAFFREVSVKLNEDHCKEITAAFNECDKTPIHNKYYDREGKLILNVDVVGFEKVYAKLHLIELELRKLADSKGLLIPDKKSSFDAVEE